MTTGMTLKQYAKHRFWMLVEQYNEAKKHMDTKEGREAFILLSIQIHVAKGQVPKALWKYAR